MKKNRLVFSIAAIAISGIFLTTAFWGFNNDSSYAPRQNDENQTLQKGIHGALAYYHSIKANQVSGEIDFVDVLRAEEEVAQLASSRSSALNLSWQEMGPDNVGGRTRALLIDPTNPSRMYAGGVAGGLWVSNNAGGLWYKVDDGVENLAVSCVTRASNGDIYYGTGEGLYYPSGTGTGGIIGRGVWKSADNGNTFTHLASTKPSNGNTSSEEWAIVNDIAAHPTNPQIIYAGTSRGLRVSEDGGATWTNSYILGPQVTPTPLIGVVTDIDIANYNGNMTFVVSINNKAYISSTGTAGSFVNKSVLSTGGLPPGGSRAEFAIAPSNPNIIYAALAKSGIAKLQGVYYTADKGENWTLIGPGGTVEFEPFGDNGQGSYDNALGVNPNDEGELIFGGVQLWRWKRAQVTPVTGQWERAAYEFPDSPQNPLYVHSDKHDIQWHPTQANCFYVATDGGVFVTYNGYFFTPINKNYNVTQFYSVAFSGKGEILGGTQDNGTQYIDFTGNSYQSAIEVSGGDGAHCEISQLNYNVLFSTSQYGFLSRSNATTGGTFYSPALASSFIPGSSGAPFVTPIELWESFDDPNSQDSVFFVASPMTQGIGQGNGANKAFSATLTPTQASASIVPGSIKVKVGTTPAMDDAGNPGTSLAGPGGSGNVANGNQLTILLANAPSANTIVSVTYDIEYAPGAVVKAESKTAEYPFDYQLQSGLSAGASILLHDRVQSKFAFGIDNSVWITRRALDFGADPSWIKVANINGTSNMAFTKDGTILYVGAYSRVYRISNLNALVDSMKTPTSGSPAETAVQVDLIYSNGTRTVTDVAVDPNNNDHVVVTLGNYGNTSYIFRSTNATSTTPTFSSKQGTSASTKLPAMPVYSAMIDRTDAKKVIIGTEYGIFSTSDITVSNPVWTAENDGMPRVPVFMLRQQTHEGSWPRQILNPGVIYAASHGRGFFKTNTLASPDVSAPFEEASVKTKENSMKVYPNPMTNIANVNFTLAVAATNAYVKFYDFNGKIAKIINLQKVKAGNQTITFDNLDLPAGTYFVRLEAGEVKLNAKLVVIK